MRTAFELDQSEQMNPDTANHIDFSTGDALASLKKGDSATVIGMQSSNDADQQAITRRLLELGFAEGEPVRVIAESFPGRDPIAVRLGNTTFALRRHEAALIRVSRSGAGSRERAGKQ
jgi:ferrous iron transport protein A